ncbi:MAG: ABC transporter permease [Chloroflexi bacterium]|nr:MAG: ABC transporter permease [Chloroflexota bacterium]
MTIAGTATTSSSSAERLSSDDVAAEQARARQAAAARRGRRRLSVLGIRLASLAVVLLVWQLGGQRIDPILFTTPSAVASAAVQMVTSGELWSYLFPSLVVLFVGLLISAVAGIGVGLLLARYWALDVALDMYITFLYSTPTVALVPLIVLWVGFESTAKIVILFLFAFFPLVINTYQGVKNVDPRLLEVGRAFRCSERQLWTNIVLPAALPFIVTGLRLAVGRGLIGMVLADLYTAISGIGYLIVRSASTYRVDKMFVPIVVLGVLGITLTALLRAAERWVAPWTAADAE